MALGGELDHRAAAPRPVGDAPSARVALLDVDPDLAAGLTPGQRERAHGELIAPVLKLPRGEWAGGSSWPADRGHVGLLMLSGVMAREVVLADTVSTELIGHGDMIRPWSRDTESQLLVHTVRWQVLAEVRLAVLGRAFAAAAARWPEINVALIDRAGARAHRLATTQAISHLNSVERRLVALFWHLAERWGRIAPDGVVVPLKLSHRLIAELVGARRPTVSSALAALAREGTLVRRTDASWLLTGDPPGAPTSAVSRLITHRRRLFDGERA